MRFLLNTDSYRSAFFTITANGLHKTSKGVRAMNYQEIQQFERATMPKLPLRPLLVLCSVMPRFYFFDFQQF